MQIAKNRKFIISGIIVVVLLFIITTFVVIKNANAASGDWDDYISTSVLTKDTDNYYIIKTAEELAKCNYYSSTYYATNAKIRLYANISLSAHYWTPRTFNGEFDGNGYTISYLNVNVPTGNNAGLFGECSNANVHDLILYSANVTGCKNSGALVGSTSGTTTITNISVRSSLVYANNNTSSSNTYHYAGGVVGYSGAGNISYCRVENCSVYSRNNDSSHPSAYLYAGGIAGYKSSGNIEKCYTRGGYVRSGYSSGALYASTTYAGGILGYGFVNITNCFSQSSYIYSARAQASNIVVSYAYSGGIAGICSGKIDGCFNRSKVYAYAKENTSGSGTITKYSNANAGGICGALATISNCYNTGNIIGGKENKTFNVNYSITKQRGEQRGSARWTSNHTEKITGTITILSKVYYDDIQPNTSSLTNCYGIKNPFSNDASFSLSSSYIVGGAMSGNGTYAGTYSYSASNSGYMDVYQAGNTNGIAKNITSSVNLHGYIASWNVYSDLQVRIEYSATALKLTFYYKQQDSYNGGKTQKSESILSDTSLNRTYKYTLKTTDQLKNVSLGSAFTTDANINDGLPYVKDFYWKNDVSRPAIS